jgi:hypothetical protein
MPVVRVIVVSVILGMIVLGVICLILGVVVSSVRIEARRWRSRRGRYGLLVTVRRIKVFTTGMSRVIAERDAFEITWGAADRFRLTKRNVVRRLAIEDEIGGLFGRK